MTKQNVIACAYLLFYSPLHLLNSILLLLDYFYWLCLAIAVDFVLTCSIKMHAGPVLLQCINLCVMAMLVGVVVLPTDPNALHLPPADLHLCLVPPAPASPMKCPNRLSERGRPLVHHTHQLWEVRRPTRSSSHASGRCLTRALIR